MNTTRPSSSSVSSRKNSPSPENSSGNSSPKKTSGSTPRSSNHRCSFTGRGFTAHPFSTHHHHVDTHRSSKHTSVTRASHGHRNRFRRYRTRSCTSASPRPRGGFRIVSIIVVASIVNPHRANAPLAIRVHNRSHGSHGSIVVVGSTRRASGKSRGVRNARYPSSPRSDTTHSRSARDVMETKSRSRSVSERATLSTTTRRPSDDSRNLSNGEESIHRSSVRFVRFVRAFETRRDARRGRQSR